MLGGMARRSPVALVVLPLVLSLGGCGLFPGKPQRPAWRTRAEESCLAEQRVQLSSYVQIADELDGPGICGLTRPFKVTALQEGAVAFNSTATLDCSMVAELEAWLAEVVQPAARARFGVPVVRINSKGSYACRGMNGQYGAPLSEHAFGNAFDISGFILADGREISIARDWTRGDQQTKDFLWEVHGGSCGRFSTVLSPGSNMFHYDHIHVDLARHGRDGARYVCKPAPRDPAPLGLPALLAREPVDEDMEERNGPPRAAFERSAPARGEFFSMAVPRGLAYR